MLEKVASEYVTPPNGPSVALTSTLLLVLFLTPGAIFGQQTIDKTSAGGTRSERSDQRQSYWRTLVTAALLAGIAPLFGFSAIAIGPVGYVTALFKLSAVLTVVWGWLFLNERGIRQRLLGALLMAGGGVLVVV